MAQNLPTNILPSQVTIDNIEQYDMQTTNVVNEIVNVDQASLIQHIENIDNEIDGFSTFFEQRLQDMHFIDTIDKIPQGLQEDSRGAIFLVQT